MDRKVSARFWRVSKKNDSGQDFGNLLIEMASPQKVADRERELDGGVTIRIEQCTPEGSAFISGQFCRKQTVNIPPSAGPDGLSPTPLAAEHGLGRLAAFRLHIPTRVLLLQTNRECASPSRLCSYICTDDPSNLYSLSPVLQESALKRIKGRRIKKFTVKYSNPETLSALHQEGDGAVRAFKMLSEYYGGLDIEISVGVGRKKNVFLNSAIVKKTLALFSSNGEDVEKLQAILDPAADDRAVDFMGDQLEAEMELNLDDQDPVQNYSARHGFLKSAFNANMAYIAGLYIKGT